MLKWLLRSKLKAKLLAVFMLIAVGIWGADKIFPIDTSLLEDGARCLYGQDNFLLHVSLSPERNMNRQHVRLEEIDAHFLRKLINTEDKRFYYHPGIDPLAFLRAFWQLLLTGHVKSGASTITMQTIRLLERRPRTYLSKIVEAMRAIQLESHYSKNEILQMYLTLTPYGGNIEGVKAASYAYFNHHCKYLSAGESALLISLPRSPTRFRPDRHLDRATKIRNLTLLKFLKNKLITKEEYIQALQEQVPSTVYALPKHAPHLSYRLLQASKSGDVHSFIDQRIQRALESFVDMGQKTNASILVVDHTKNVVVAYVGSDKFLNDEKHGQVDYIQAIRSPGSTIKPFIYAMAMDIGLVDDNSILQDYAHRYGSYSPENIDSTFHGQVSVRQALYLSLNTTAVKLLQETGALQLWDNLRQAGMKLYLNGKPNLSLALGGFGTNLESLVLVYGSFANSGVVKPLKIATNLQIGETYELMSSYAANTILDILEQKENNSMIPGIAYKTGTSYGHRDTWAIGLNGKYTVGVWVGNPDGSPMRDSTGSSSAVPVLCAVFRMLPEVRLNIKYNKKNMLKPNLIQTKVTRSLYSDFKISFPIDGASIELGETAIPLETENETGEVKWFINNKPHYGEWMPDSSGFYQITAVDVNNSASNIEVHIQKE